MIPGCLAALLARLSCRAVDLEEIGATRSIMVSPRGALLFVAKLFTLLFNKFAKHDADEAVVNDIDDSGEFENPVADESPRGSQQLALNKFKNPAADESQESHSPSPSFCLCNAMALC